MSSRFIVGAAGDVGLSCECALDGAEGLPEDPQHVLLLGANQLFLTPKRKAGFWPSDRKNIWNVMKREHRRAEQTQVSVRFVT